MQDVNPDQIKRYKRSFTETLRPFLELLKHQQSIVSPEDWQVLVSNLVIRINENPTQYLAHDLPSTTITADLVKQIFEEFVHHAFQPERTNGGFGKSL